MQACSTTHVETVHRRPRIHDQQIPKLPKMPSTSEERVIEFEVRPVKGKKLPETLKGAAFYFVCQLAWL